MPMNATRRRGGTRTDPLSTPAVTRRTGETSHPHEIDSGIPLPLDLTTFVPLRELAVKLELPEDRVRAMLYGLWVPLRMLDGNEFYDEHVLNCVLYMLKHPKSGDIRYPVESDLEVPPGRYMPRFAIDRVLRPSSPFHVKLSLAYRANMRRGIHRVRKHLDYLFDIYIGVLCNFMAVGTCRHAHGLAVNVGGGYLEEES